MRIWIFSVFTAVLLGHPVLGQAGMFDNLPDMIHCKTPKGTIVLYLDRIQDGGSAYYRGLGGGIAELDANGVLHRENQPDCDGKSLDQLRAEGKTWNTATPELE
ncbi:MAG: hypothetical protein OEU92_25865 [Alphaproteobacteria bacterium]|nr:hypothetical protein [Alphaproteobacteria bacterium]